MTVTDSRKQRKAARRIQGALKKDPYDIKSLLEWASILSDLEKPDLVQKRKVLHHILCLEQGNHTARQMLFEMDRVEIGGKPSRLSLAVILTEPSPNDLPDPPLILKYSIVQKILVYLCIACTVLVAFLNLRLAAIGAFLLVPLWFVSAVVEISNTGLRVSRLFGSIQTEFAWRDIRGIKITGRGIKITTPAGKAVQLSALLQGYPFIIDILHQMRPDLFDASDGSWSGKAVSFGRSMRYEF